MHFNSQVLSGSRTRAFLSNNPFFIGWENWPKLAMFPSRSEPRKTFHTLTIVNILPRVVTVEKSAALFYGLKKFRGMKGWPIPVQMSICIDRYPN